jgi:Flp pilus assembly pilin Flp
LSVRQGVAISADGFERWNQNERRGELKSVQGRVKQKQEYENMNTIRKVYVKVQNMRRGQTMTEYALILAAVAVVVFITYEVMGQDISKMVNSVDNALTSS